MMQNINTLTAVIVIPQTGIASSSGAVVAIELIEAIKPHKNA